MYSRNQGLKTSSVQLQVILSLSLVSFDSIHCVKWMLFITKQKHHKNPKQQKGWETVGQEEAVLSRSYSLAWTCLHMPRDMPGLTIIITGVWWGLSRGKGRGALALFLNPHAHPAMACQFSILMLWHDRCSLQSPEPNCWISGSKEEVSAKKDVFLAPLSTTIHMTASKLGGDAR